MPGGFHRVCCCGGLACSECAGPAPARLIVTISGVVSCGCLPFGGGSMRWTISGINGTHTLIQLPHAPCFWRTAGDVFTITENYYGLPNCVQLVGSASHGHQLEASIFAGLLSLADIGAGVFTGFAVIPGGLCAGPYPVLVNAALCSGGAAIGNGQATLVPG